jgi:hypothetical protein
MDEKNRSLFTGFVIIADEIDFSRRVKMDVTVNISHQLYERARQLAKKRQQTVDVVLADALDQGLTQSAQTSVDAVVAREKAAYQQLYATLAAQFFGQHVAIYGGELVDHDEDGIALSHRIYEQYPDEFVWITQVAERPFPEFRSRSFRWAND